MSREMGHCPSQLLGSTPESAHASVSHLLPGPVQWWHGHGCARHQAARGEQSRRSKNQARGQRQDQASEITAPPHQEGSTSTGADTVSQARLVGTNSDRPRRHRLRRH